MIFFHVNFHLQKYFISLGWRTVARRAVGNIKIELKKYFYFFILTLDLAPDCRIKTMGQSALQIGEVANRSGVSVDTVRYYERRRLLSPAARSSGGFRIFSQETVQRIKFIKHAQEMGFSLDEIREIVSDSNGIDECQRVHHLLNSKLSDLDERMKKMREFRRLLQKNLAACEQEIIDHGNEAHCPVIVNIESGDKATGRNKSYEQQ